MPAIRPRTRVVVAPWAAVDKLVVALDPVNVGAHLAARGQVAVIGKREGLAESTVVFSALIR